MPIPYIYQRTITSGTASGSVEKGVALQNATMVRRFGTTDWTKMRVGMRYRLMPTSSAVSASFPPGIPVFWFGFCNGTTNVPGDKSVDQFMGCGVNDDAVNYNDTSYVNIVTSGYTVNPASASFESSSNIHMTNGQYFGINYFVAYRTSSLDAIFFDIQKTGSSYLPGALIRTSPSLNVREYYSLSQFTTDIQADTPAHDGYVYQPLVTKCALPLSFTTNPLNAVVVHWERTDPILEIVDLYLVRLA